MAGKLNYSLAVVIKEEPIKSSVATAERAKSARQPSASVKSARASAKARMKAEGMGKQQTEPELVKEP